MDQVTIDYIKSRPHLKVIYFNSEGEHSWFKDPKFPIVKSREEVLGEAKPKEEKTETKINKNTKKK